MENYQKLLKLTSLFLQYPEQEWAKNEKELTLAINSVKGGAEKGLLIQFKEYLAKHDIDKLCENYVQTFDFSKNNSLYITYPQHGDQKERGDSLLKLKELYEKAEFILDTNELPDYLPLILEFAAFAPLEYVEELLLQQKDNIFKLAEGLAELDSPYANVLNVCQKVIEWLGQQQLSKVREGVL